MTSVRQQRDVFGTARNDPDMSTDDFDDVDGKKGGMPIWGYFALGIISAWLISKVMKEYMGKDAKSTKQMQKPQPSSSSSAAKNRTARRSSLKAGAAGGATGMGAGADGIVPQNVHDMIESVTSAHTDGPDTGLEGYTPKASTHAMQGASLDHAFAPFDDGESTTVQPKSKTVVADSFNRTPHKNKNGMPAVTKQGLQEQKLRALSKRSKHDRIPEFKRKYNNRSDRPPPDYKNRNSYNSGSCGLIDKDLFNVDPSTVYVDDDNMDAAFGKAYAE